VTIARRRVIDAHRRWTRDRRQTPVTVVPVDPSSVVLDRAVNVDLDDDLWCRHYANDRLDLIARRLSEGATQVAIAAELGISAQRVMQLVARMRDRLTTEA